ncbi:MAG: aminoacyl-tRNA hydrolase [Verrucomicrobia bacterium]|nr:aminoacyl-tRNA hydrolase [Verrucomicrobiota bacterium]
MSITLVAGLGNPGREYEVTRHNLGWVVVDAFARKLGLSWKAQPQFEAEVARWDVAPGRTCHFAKPLTYMNGSGAAVGALARYYKVPLGSIVAVYDDLTIDLGLVKVSVSGSAGGHNGVASLLEHLGDGFVRYRLGIGPKEPAQMDLKDFVLGKFTPEQHTLLTKNLETYISGLDLLLSRGVEAAMNQLNRRDPK